MIKIHSKSSEPLSFCKTLCITIVFTVQDKYVRGVAGRDVEILLEPMNA